MIPNIHIELAKKKNNKKKLFRIEYLQPRKALVKDWFGNDKSRNLAEKLEFTQQSPYDQTYVQHGFNGQANYSLNIHEVWNINM